jgi:hypothetical protein
MNYMEGIIMDEHIKKQFKLLGWLLLFGVLMLSAISLLNNDEQKTVYIDTSTDATNNFLPRVNAKQLEWNNVQLTDHTMINVTENLCYGSNLGMKIKIYPCVAQDVDGKDIEQEVTFNWTGNSQRNITWIFVYEGELKSGKVFLERNESYIWVNNTIENRWISNYLVSAVSNYVDLGSPNSLCQVGNSNNTRMYNVTRNNGTAIVNEIYCFTDLTTINATAFRISGNYDAIFPKGVVAYRIIWDDITEMFEYVGKGLLQDNRSYYKVSSSTFNPNQAYKTKWIYTPKDNSKYGKWHILGFEKEKGLIDAISDEQYIYIDPWWSASWSYKKGINITSVSSANTVNYTVKLYINASLFTGINGTFKDIRFTDSSETVELPYWIENYTLGSFANVWVKTNLSSTGNTTIYIYYGNNGASTTSNIKTAFLVGDDFADGVVDTNIWQYSGNFTEQNNMLIANGGASPPYIEGNASSSATGGLWMEFLFAETGTPDTTQTGFAVAGDRGATQTSGKNGIRTYSSGQFYGVDQLGAGNIGADTGSRDAFNKIRLVINSTTIVQDRVGVGTRTTNGGIANVNVTFSIVGSAVTGRTISIKNITLRKYNNPEPQAYFSTAETPASSVITIDLNSPANAFRTNNSNVALNWTIAPTDANITNWTLSVWYSNSSIAYTHSNLSINSNISITQVHDVSLLENSYIWNVYSCGLGTTGVLCAWDTANRTFIIHTGVPQFVLNNLTNLTTISLPINQTLNVTTSDPELNVCRYKTSENSAYLVYTCNTTQTISFASGGIKNITVYANDTYGNSNETTYYFNIYDFNVTQYENADPIAEGSSSTVYLNINSTSFAIGDADAIITYNNSEYSPTSKTVVNTNTILFSYTFPITSGWGNSTGKTYSYNWTYNTTQLSTRNTSTQTQTIISFGIDDCSVYSVRIANFSLKDEQSNAYLSNATSKKIEIETLTTSLSNPNITWSYSNSWTNRSSVVLCVPSGILNNTNLTIDITAGFEMDGYVREFWYLDNGTLSKNQYPFNSYTAVNVSLMDLLTTDSTTFLFEFTDEDGLQVEDAIVHVYRKYIGGGLFREVERSRQDNNGQTHVHLVEEDVIYYFVVTQNGQIIYTSDTYNAKCLTTPCEITLSASPDTIDWNVIDNEGGKYAVTTDRDARTVTTTFSIDSIETVNMSLYIFNGANATLVNSTSLSATAGTLSMTVPIVYGNQTFFVAIYRSGEFIKSAWIDMTTTGKDYFGTTGAILGGLVILAMMLMAITEGAGFIVVTVLALIVVSVMKLVDLNWMALISIVCAGGIILWKLVNRRNKSN